LTSDDKGAFADAFSTKVVRVDSRCTADPFLADATGYDAYSCPGQREAIRAAFLMKPGHTLVVNLPTGSGKSLVGQAPALVHKGDGHLTLFVVPTVALAIDQDRQMTAYFAKSGARRWPLAWHGGMSAGDRAEIRSRMRNGTQRILFTSPEALVTSLLRSVFDAADAGMLRYLVIDEAHLVSQWGDDFRPAFQALAGIRNALQRHTQFSAVRTLLLSATFTPDTVASLASLFGPPDRVHMISAVHLRPEPQYWFYPANSSHEKQERVLEALQHAPRPFILYLTTREDATRWHQLLQTRLGLTRTACFHGETSDQQRKSILKSWTENKLDGVVATSAFGVGIDKADVRTVVHATIPEALDRFYQEVGRGGRDGCPSVSLLVHNPPDWAVAKSVSRRTIISEELGYSRWKALYESRKSAEADGLFKVDIETVPGHRTGSNEYNVDWNMHTLLLMVRAGLIELDVQPSDEPTDDESSEFTPSSALSAMARIRVRILNHGHGLQETWERDVGMSRTASRQSAEYNLRLMENLLVRRQEVAESLAKLYRNSSSQWPVDVTEVCGGCPADRLNLQRHQGYRVPLAVALRDVEEADASRWTGNFPWLDPSFILIFFDARPADSTSEILKLLSWLVSQCDLQEIGLESRSALGRMQEIRSLYRRSPRGMLVHRDLAEVSEEPYSPLFRVSILENDDAQAVENLRALQRPRHLVLLPIGTRDSTNPHRFLVDTVTCGIRLETINSVLTI
jgi:superfamily II DNA/RNA helicase